MKILSQQSNITISKHKNTITHLTTNSFKSKTNPNPTSNNPSQQKIFIRQKPFTTTKQKKDRPLEQPFIIIMN